MDLFSVHHVNYNNPSPIFPRNSFLDKPLSFNHPKNSSSFSPDRLFEFRISKRKHGYTDNKPNKSLIVQALGKKNSSSSNGDHQNSGANNKRNNNNHSSSCDWREFRATLFAREQAESGSVSVSESESKPLGLKWAHPISLPETGCVLVATEKLDGVGAFERSVVLLLRSGNGTQGPFGVVINRPLHKKIKHMKPNNLDLATTFADCALHFGGPLEASMFLLRTGEKEKQKPGFGFEEVIPGLCFGTRNGLDDAMELVKKGLVKPHDFQFFVGYAGWQIHQLRDEIESNYWHVAACSSNLLFASNSSQGLWEEILQLMGGHYSELSRKPKQDL